MNKSGSGIKIVVVRRKKSNAANPDLGRLKTVKDWGAIWLEEGTGHVAVPGGGKIPSGNFRSGG